jgi:hypothetical protein
MNICKSHLNNKNRNIHCTRITVIGQDFCKYHIKTKKYMHDNLDNNIKPSIEELDRSNSETLLYIYDSWNEVPECYWIKINKRWWDCRILSGIFAQQLCNNDMEGPKPSYPHDPFDRFNIIPSELILLNELLNKNHIKLYCALNIFLDSNIQDYYHQKYETSYKMSNEIIILLKSKLRYKIINNKNSQHCYTGIWVDKNEPLSKFENLYLKFNNLPIQSIMYNLYGDPLYVNNPQRSFIQSMMDILPEENPCLQ